MELNKLKTALEKTGYAVSYRKQEDFLVAGIKDKTDSDLGINTMTKAFTVKTTNNKIEMTYSYYQL